MKRWLASSVILLVLAGGAMAGIPLNFGQSDCSMGGTMEMDCCKAALMQSQTPEAAAAKLCCAVNCAQNGTASPPGIVRVTPPAPSLFDAHSALTRPSARPVMTPQLVNRSPDPSGSPPTYLRNLSLLI